LLGVFKEALSNKKPAKVDLTGDGDELARTSRRVIVPTVEKGIQRMEAKKKHKRPTWQH
jgi:hypothetical protein